MASKGINKVINFIRSLQFIFHPDSWIRIYPTSKKLDIQINSMLDKGIKFTNVREYEGLVNLCTIHYIWIYDYPFSFGKCYHIATGEWCMPSRLTCKRLKKELTKQEEMWSLEESG